MPVPPNDRRNITLWDSEDAVLESEYGIITYLDWCQREARRLLGYYPSLHVARVGGYCAILRGAA